MATTWGLTSDQRADVLQRVSANICAIAMAKGSEISSDTAYTAAVAIERKAFTAAMVAARTTTGDRPLSETTKAYARKLAELALDVVKSGGKIEEQSVTAGAEELNLTGSRDFLTKDTAEDILKPLLAEGAAFKKIKFSTKSFGKEACEVAARAITNIKASLTDADISDVIAGRPEDEALSSLRTICHALAGAKLRLLNLSDNALGEKGVRACAEAFAEQPSLESMSLQNVGCSIFACKAVEELMKNTQELRQLHLFNNMSDNEGAAHIAAVLARSPKMEDFKMASSRVGPEGAAALMRGLLAGRSLVRLDISDNPMTEELAPALCALLQQQPHLKALNLNDTSLGNDGAVQVCVTLSGCCPELEELEMSLNEINPTGAKAVALAVHSKPKLTKLNLRENELEDRGAMVLAKALGGLAAIKVVDLCGNQMRRVGSVAVAKAVAGKASLELLALDENMISEDGLEELRGVMSAAGKAQALGPLDENMEEDDDEEVEEDEDEEDGGAAEQLTAMLAKAGLA